MRKRRLLALAAVTTALVGAVAAPAAADTRTAASDVAVPGHDAYADLVEGGKFIAQGYFKASGDSFYLTKKSSSTYPGRPYLEYKYIKINGQLQEGIHHGLSTVGVTAGPFKHNFGEERAVKFRVCVEDTFFDPCSDWETGYA